MSSKEHYKIFGTDGVRGRANHFPMTVEVALALGRSAGKMFRRHKGRHRVVIGKDTRRSCYMFENALIAGLCSMGVDTLMVGPLPTPGVAFLTRAYRADAGIVISASHNPYYDNGIKFFSPDGFKLSNEWEEEMERNLELCDFSDDLPGDAEIGRNTKVHDAQGRYIELAKAVYPRGLTLDGFKIALDCANGSAYTVAPLIFTELGGDVITYGVQPNGLNINDNCGALHPENVRNAVLKHQADIGIALDGDGDRLILVDELGNIIDGDQILAICAMNMMERKMLRGNRLVLTSMSNLGIVKHLNEIGIQTIFSDVGDRHVIEKMIEEDANLGGEQSGHLIFLDHNTTGDGLVSALQVLSILKERGTTLSELAGQFLKYPQICLNVKVSQKPPLESLPNTQNAIDKATKKLGEEGRVFVRYSGTEDLLRVMVEAKEGEVVEELATSIANAAKEEIGER
ncbi:MAG: phosphoglucosamine mutase [Waddliaceae bacterium]